MLLTTNASKQKPLSIKQIPSSKTVKGTVQSEKANVALKKSKQLLINSMQIVMQIGKSYMANLEMANVAKNTCKQTVTT